MILDASTPRCQGRIVRSMGTAMLVRECQNCVRRTDVPADVKSVPWMRPPPFKWSWWPVCESKIEPSDDTDVVIV